jgi:methionyl-tRNA formyltransferase
VSTLRIVFAGTPDFACPSLDVLIARRPPIAVLTQPDRPAGRGRRRTASPVKQRALAANLDVMQPERLRGDGAVADLRARRPDLLVTAAYGLLLPRDVLALPRLGCWNLHASLLPRWRGASPIQQAILAGDERTGITLMQMDAGLDTGDVILQRATPIERDESAGELHDRLAALAADVLSDALQRLDAGTLPEPRPQDETGATHAPMIRKSDARLDWRADADVLARQIRAFNPWPVAHGEIDGERVRVFRARAVAADAGDIPPGRPVTGRGHPDRIRIACGRGQLELLELQAPGRRRVLAAEWLNAHPAWRG